ncbi:hypothetical protein RUND412_010282 [Rhizina undulata]
MLVDYSDSESDSEKQEKPTSPADLPPKKTGLSALLPKPKSRKLVKDGGNSDGPKKLFVNLPKAADADEDGPPTKKAKIGGGGSGLSALLPAPKRSGGAKNTPIATLPEQKSGPLEDTYARPKTQTVNGTLDNSDGNSNSSIKFITQSLAKKSIQPGSSFKKPGFRGTTKSSPPKPKISLFGSGASLSSIASSKTATVSKSKSSGDYKPIMLSAPKPASKPKEESFRFEESAYFEGRTPEDEVYSADDSCTTMVSKAEPQDLETAAREAGLDEKAMRQLYGRNGRDRTVPINIATFSVDEEYKSNEEKRALGLVEEVKKPVRSIATGKHQLSSLVNAVQSQRGALEESFMQGRKNKREAGSKYGWS